MECCTPREIETASRTNSVVTKMAGTMSKMVTAKVLMTAALVAENFRASRSCMG